MQGQKLLTLLWRSFSRSGREHIAFSLAFKRGQYINYALQRTSHFSITWLTRLKIVDAQLMLIFRMGQGACDYLFCFGIRPIPHLWSFASNHHLDYSWIKTTNHWRTDDYHVQDGALSMCLLLLLLKAVNSSEKDNRVRKLIFCDQQLGI